MAYTCIRGCRNECDGCGGCEEDVPVGICAHCHEEVLVDEEVYILDGMMLHEDCLKDYLRPYLKAAEKSDCWLAESPS